MTSTDNTTIVIDADPRTDSTTAPADQAHTDAGFTGSMPQTAPQPMPTAQAAQHIPVAQAPAAPATQADGAFAITSFVIGIASVVSSWTFVAPIIGLVFGILALRRNTKERTLALWGVWLNGAMLVFTVIFGMIAVAAVGFSFLASIPFWGN